MQHGMHQCKQIENKYQCNRHNKGRKNCLGFSYETVRLVLTVSNESFAYKLVNDHKRGHYDGWSFPSVNAISHEASGVL